MEKMIAALVKDEKGNVLILVPAFLLLATFFLALVVDLGSVHYCRARLQDAADAAAWLPPERSWRAAWKGPRRRRENTLNITDWSPRRDCPMSSPGLRLALQVPPLL
jgi:hypothetical protein